jgi:hypothetical protein
VTIFNVQYFERTVGLELKYVYVINLSSYVQCRQSTLFVLDFLVTKNPSVTFYRREKLEAGKCAENAMMATWIK